MKLLSAISVFITLGTAAAPARAQMPSDLRQAMQSRDSAVARNDAATWDRLTATGFSVVQEDGVMMTKAARLAQMKGAAPSAFQARTQETVTRFGDVWVARFRSGNSWVMEIWARENGIWKAAAVQVTTARK